MKLPRRNTLAPRVRPRALVLAAAAFAALASLAADTAFRVAGARAGAQEHDAHAPSAVVQLSLQANDLAYDPSSQRIYASVPAGAADRANTVTPINPSTGALEAGIFVGADPNRLALSGDGQYLYAGLDGEGAVRRVELATRTAGLQFSLGTTLFERFNRAQDMAVLPGRPGSIVVARHEGFGTHTGLVVYDEGVARPKMPDVTAEPCNDVELDETGALAFGHNSQNSESGFRKLAIADDGITLVSRAFNLFLQLPGMKYRGGRVYARSGEVVSPETMSAVGKFPLPSHGYAVAPDPSNNRVYFITNTETGFNKYLLAFDSQTFLLVGKLTLTNVSGDPASLIRWGATGLAFRTTGGQVFLLHTTDIPAPPPTPLPQPTQVAPGVVRLPLATNDLAYDPATQKVYASVPSRAGTFGNSIAPLDPATGAASTPVPVGGEPNKLAAARAGQHLYAGLDGPGSVRRFDTLSQTAGAEFSLGAGANGTMYARDIEVSPDDANVVAVARRNKTVSPDLEGVAVYENGVKRPSEISRNFFVNVIEFSATGSTLYGLDTGSTESFLYKMNVDSGGASLVKSTGVILGAGDMRWSDGLLYATNGQVADPEAFKLTGSLAARGPVLPDPSAGRVYVLGHDNSTGAVTLFAFDRQTLVPLGYMNVPGVSGNASSLVRAGADSLAFRTSADQVYFLRLSSLQSFDAPTPGPVPRADGVRQVSLAANDFAFNPLDGQFYVSVPSHAGARGNSITTVDPSSGAVGNSTFVGSEPDALAVSTDGSQLYVALLGSASVRRFHAPTKTPGLSFDLGRSSDPTLQHWGPPYPRALAVVPGNPNAVAVSRYFPPVGAGGGVYVYDDGVQRPKGGVGSRLEFTEEGALLSYNGDNTEFGFRKMTLGPDGLTETANALGVMGGFGTGFKYAAGRAYGDEGSVIDTAGALARAGKFSTPGGRLAAPDPSGGLVYYAQTTPAGGALALEAYDKNTFIQVGAGRLEGVRAGTQVVKFVRYGADGLALLTDDGQLFFFSTSAVRPLAPTAAPTPAQVAEGVRQIPLVTNDIVYDRVSGKIYASVPSRFMSDRPSIENVPGAPVSFGNSVVPIDPSTGAIGPAVFVGSEPRKLAASKDGRYLYAALEATGEVRRVHLPTLAAGMKFPLRQGADGPGFSRADEIEVMPGSPGTIAVARGRDGSPHHERVVIYDDGAARPATTNQNGLEISDVIEFSSSPSTLYGLDNETTDFALRKMRVDASGVSVVSKAKGFFEAFGADMKFDRGLLYTTTGKVIDPEASAAVGQFPGMGEVTQSGLVIPDSSVNRVFFLKGSGGATLTLVAYDQTTMQQTGSMTIPSDGGFVTSFIRWGADGFAFRTQDIFGGAGKRLYLVRSSALVPPRVAGPSALQFDAAARSVTEGAWEVTVKVTRTGDTFDPAAVSYETTDGTASETSDYTAALGTLRFEPGETEKTFPVLVTTDARAEADETFTVALKNAEGASLGAASVLTVTIKDGGGLPAGPSPLRWDSFDASVFVRQHYLDFLNRNPDPSGHSFWVNEINSCGASVPCQEVKRVNVSAAFFLSIEFQQTGYLAYRAYKAAFGDIEGRAVPITLDEFLHDTREIGGGVVVGQGNWQARLEDNKRAYFERLVRGARFAARHPQTLTAEQFVAALDSNAGGVLTAGEKAQLASALAPDPSDARLRAEVLLKVAENAELARREFNRAFVLMQYFGYLRRDPDESGYNHWLGKLNQFGGNFVRAEMVKAFLLSTEYTQRLGQ